MLFGVFPLTIRDKETRNLQRSFINSIYLFSRFFGAKYPNKRAIAEMRDYEG